MNPIIRNFLRTIRRYKMAVALNILGLSIAFAVFIIIMFKLDYHFNFAKCHKDYDKIFRVERFSISSSGDINAYLLLSRPFANHFFELSPHIDVGAFARIREQDALFQIVENETQHYYKESSLIVSAEFFDVFSFDFVEGGKSGHIEPGSSMVIPLSLSRKLFGNESAVGQLTQHEYFGYKTVVGVYRDFPTNTFVNNCIYFVMNPNENINDWNANNYCAYIRVNHADNASQLVENFNRTFDAKEVSYNSMSNLRLNAISDIHFSEPIESDYIARQNKQELFILLSIGLLALVIAAINFTNFSIALSYKRIKSINTQRVFGAQRMIIRLSIIFEAVFLCLLSCFFAMCLVSISKATMLPNLITDVNFSLSSHSLIVSGMAFFALFVGLIVGLYPSFYMTTFEPALVLKGSFGQSPKGKKMRNTLIGFQFVVSFALMIVASFMYLQNHFMRHSDMGYDKDDLLVVPIMDIKGGLEPVTHQIKLYSGIEDVTYINNLLSSSTKFWELWRDYKDKRITFESSTVHHTFLKMMGIEVTEGRDFMEEDVQTGALVFNETARKKYDLEIGEMIENEGRIIGFIPDIKYSSFRVSVKPMAFQVNNGVMLEYVYIKLATGADKRAAISYIRSTLDEFTNTPFEVQSFDDVVKQAYEKERSQNVLVGLSGLIAIFISIVGVFGLVVFDSECRRKEVGIRKILGASTMGIIVMFNKSYFRILVICFVIAAPLAWYAVTRWLENFAYKTPMYWWVYLIAFVAVGVITVATVTFQNWRVANDNPVNAIKNE